MCGCYNEKYFTVLQNVFKSVDSFINLSEYGALNIWTSTVV